jgi:hypothetical protein
LIEQLNDKNGTVTGEVTKARTKIICNCSSLTSELNILQIFKKKEVTSKVHPCTGTEALYRLYGP